MNKLYLVITLELSLCNIPIICSTKDKAIAYINKEYYCVKQKSKNTFFGKLTKAQKDYDCIKIIECEIDKEITE